MTTRPPADRSLAITMTDLHACLTAADVFTLFRKLGYPMEEELALALEADDLPGALRDGVVARYPVATIGGARPGDPRLDVTLFVLRATEKAGPVYLARNIAQQWTRRFAGYHLLVFAVPNAEGAFQRLFFVNPRRLGEGAVVRVKLHKLIVERVRPTRHDAETLNAIAITPGMSADQVYGRHIAAFDVERLTETFYKDYHRRFQAAMARIKADNPHLSMFADEKRLRAFTQRLFGRLMFLYFLQKKGALNDDQNFITEQYTRAVRANGNFYLDALYPLYFETLNKREDKRTHEFARAIRAPYLNGGLFAADDDDRALPNIANDLFDDKSEAGLLNFLNSYNFTIEEDTPLETQVALDPEMLGKVFENLLEVEERGKSGTFYTPRAVVAFMCREALAAYLSRAVPELASEPLGWLLDEAETGEPTRDAQGHELLTYTALSRNPSPRDLIPRIEAALQAVRILDPAVGSGAFPLGMLALLIGARRALHRIRDNVIDPHAQLIEDWKRDFIRDCLYGVDIRPEAIEIARLRLWLSLVVDADPFHMEPLPNLDFKLMSGDSLIETLDGVPIYPTRPKEETGPKQVSYGDEERKALIAQLKQQQQRLFQPQEGDDPAELRRRVTDTEVAIVKLSLAERVERESSKLNDYTLQLANLAQARETPAVRKERERFEQQIAQLQRSIDATDAAQRDLKAGVPLPFFLYRLHYANVFEERGGFDIVIANPPYVRHEKVAPATLAALKTAYPNVAQGMADLYVYFYARALQLLRDGGALCFISSNKFFRAGYGKKLRETLASATSMRAVIDFGDFPVFDAAAYPCVVITENATPATDHTYRGLTVGPDIELDKIGLTLDRDAQNLPQAEGVQPPSGNAATSALVKRLMALGQPLGTFTGGKIYYGIKTGLNEAFVVDQATCGRLIAEDPRSAEVLKPFLRGRDVSRYKTSNPELWVIYTRHGLDVALYPAIERYLELRRIDLTPRASIDDKGPGRKPGDYEWYEVQYAPANYTVYGEPKIIYPDIAQQSQFVWDERGYYLDTTLFCIPASRSLSRWLVALLNSSVLNFALFALAPAIRGGFTRFKQQYMEQLPIVEPGEVDKRRLEALVDELQALGGVGPQAAALEREMDEIVYRTYGLTAEEVAEIERWHAERRALLGKGRAKVEESLSDEADTSGDGDSGDEDA